ncbi:hypothetical protein IP68_15280 [Blastomonas sp. AAP25]|uniref:hypothetical protein n=1 Tax=Blastomonas sp. AAP25 TaxID=1523416 RepID=UPI0006B9AD8D|nr:hypothetical protein [Blastomonas sp. AAP25]KPF73891.1 hypothetical protein IP68_15280 [Blastomonas sp. AAP25]
MPKKGKPVRPVIVPGIGEKRFRRIDETLPRVPLPVRPMYVAHDLRKGSLRSLAAYIKMHQGIADREVALELLRLLAGSAAQSRFRLVVVDHPDAPPDKGGRPSTKSKVPTQRELKRVAEYSSKLEFYGKIGIAREEASKNLKRSESTMKRAIRKVEEAEAERIDLDNALARRAAALKKLRQER